MKKFILAVLIILMFPLFSKEKYQLSVCAIFKNESKFLKEWIEYHLLVGVDHFYLYNNNSKDWSASVLRQYVKKGVVTLIHWPDYLTEADKKKAFIWPLSTQIPAYENAIKMKGSETEWLLFLDIDEFIIPVKEESLKNVLNGYKDFPAVIISTDYFDASQKKDLVVESVNMIGSSPKDLETRVEKTIFKPKVLESFCWPPLHCNFKGDKVAVKLDKKDVCVNHYVNRDNSFLSAARKAHLDNRLIPEQELQEVLNAGFEIEDRKKSIQRFIPDLRKKMGY